MANATFRILRLASITICLIVIASFGVFAVTQTKEGSVHQQEALGNVPAAAAATRVAAGSAPGSSEGTVHKALTEASNALTSPFAGIISSSSEWGTRSFKLLLALIVYGFGLGYLARIGRMRT